MIRMKKRWWFDYYSAGAYSKIGAVKDSIIYVRNVETDNDIKALIKAAKNTSNILIIPYSCYSIIANRQNILWAVVNDLSVPQIVPICSKGQCIYEESNPNLYKSDFPYHIFKWIIVENTRSLLTKYLIYGIPIWDKSRTIISKYPEEIWKIKKRQLLRR